MQRTILELRQENSEILHILQNMRNIGTTSEDAQKLFFQSKDLFFSHIEKENNVLHPVIIEGAKYDHYMSRTVSFFMEEVAGVTRLLRNFFNKHTSPGIGLQYASEFGTLYAALLQRVRLEEHAIYNIYEELKDANYLRKQG